MKMTDKQDRCGVRTASEIERKYRIGKNISEAQDTANDARQTAERAAAGVDGLDEKLDQDEIYNRLTNNGEWQGIFKGEDGKLYINATFIVAGVIKSPDGHSLIINLDDGTADLTGSIRTRSETDEGGTTHTARLVPLGLDCFTETPSGATRYSAVRGSGAAFSSVDSVVGHCFVQIATNDRAVLMLNGGDQAQMLLVESSTLGNHITGLSAPTEATAAVNKAYVDALENRIAALESMLANS